MSPEVTQLIYLGISALIGWWVRHKGIIGGDPVPSAPAAPVSHPILDAIKQAAEQAVLSKISSK